MLRWILLLVAFGLLWSGSAVAQDGAVELKPWAERLGDAGVIEPVLSKIHSNDPREGDSSQGQVLLDVDAFLLNGTLSDAPIYHFRSPLFAEYKSRWRSIQANGKLPEAFCENFQEYTRLHDVIGLAEQFSAAVNARALQFGAEDLATTRIILAQMANSSDRSEAEIVHGEFASNQYFSLAETVDGLVKIAREIDAPLPLSRMATNLASLLEDRYRNAELHTALENMCVTGWFRIKNERGNNVEEELKTEMEEMREEFPDLQLWVDTDDALSDENGDHKPQLTHSMTTYGAMYRDKLATYEWWREGNWLDHDDIDTFGVRPKTLNRYADICENVLNEDRWPASDQLRHLVQFSSDDFGFVENLGYYRFNLIGVFSSISFRHQNPTVLILHKSIVRKLDPQRSQIQGLDVWRSLICDMAELTLAEFKTRPLLFWSIFYRSVNFSNATLDDGMDFYHSFVGLDTRREAGYEDFSNAYMDNENMGGGDLDMYQVQSGGTINLNDVYIAGEYHLGNARGDNLRLENVRVEQDLNFWGSQFSGPVFFGYEDRGITVEGSLFGTYFRGSDLQISNAFFGGGISFVDSTISGSFHINKVISTNVSFRGSHFEEWLTISDLLTEKLDLSNSRVNSGLSLWQNQIGILDLSNAEIGSFTSTGKEEAEAPRAISLVTMGSGQKLALPELDEFDIYGIAWQVCYNWHTLSYRGSWLFGNPVNIWSAPTGLTRLDRMSAGLTKGGCIGKIEASFLGVKNSFVISTRIEELINLKHAQIGGIVDFSSTGGTFSPASCADLRGLRADSVLVTLAGRPGIPNALAAPGRLAIFDSDVRTIGSGSPIADKNLNEEFAKEYVNRLATAHNCQTEHKEPINLDDEGLGAFPRYSDLADYGFFVKDDPASYNPSAFDAIADGFDNAGYASMARMVRIEKNWAFSTSQWANRDNAKDWTDTTVLAATVSVYHLAGWISGFGYDNVRALLLYLIIVVIGALFYAWRAGKGAPVCPPERVRISTLRRPPTNRFKQTELANAAFKRVNARLARMEKSAQNSTFNHQHGTLVSKLLYGLWYSIDRSLPPLYADSRFDTHQNLESFLAHWFYFQRVICFVIALFFVAGAFNMFQ